MLDRSQLVRSVFVSVPLVAALSICGCSETARGSAVAEEPALVTKFDAARAWTHAHTVR